VAVRRPRRVARVVPELEIRADAVDAASADLALAPEPGRRIPPPGAAAELLPRVAGLVVHDDVQIDLPTVRRAEHATRRKTGFGRAVVSEAELCERRPGSRHVRARDDHVTSSCARVWRPTSASTPQPPSTRYSIPSASSASSTARTSSTVTTAARRGRRGG
jgi:hypothetical protein